MCFTPDYTVHFITGISSATILIFRIARPSSYVLQCCKQNENLEYAFPNLDDRFQQIKSSWVSPLYSPAQPDLLAHDTVG